MHARRLDQFAQPLAVTGGGHVGLGGCDAETFRRNQLCHAVRVEAGVERSQNAAHAVTDQAQGGIGAVLVDDGGQVAHVFGEKVGAVQPLGRAKAAPVRGDDIPVLAQGVDDKLPRCRDIHPAV